MELERQQHLMMFMLNDLAPGCICVDTTCPTGLIVPHMATDGGPHPHPYGVIETADHEWRRKPFWRRKRLETSGNLRKPGRKG